MFGLKNKIRRLELRNAQIENAMIEQHRKHDIKMANLHTELNFVASCAPLYKVGEERWFIVKYDDELKAEKFEINRVNIRKTDDEIVIEYDTNDTYKFMYGCPESKVFKTKSSALKYIKEQKKCTQHQ